MMRYPAAGGRTTIHPRFAAYVRAGTAAPLDAYQYSMVPRPARRPIASPDAEPYTVRAVAPALRPLVRRYNNRCPDCAGPLVSGEGAIACPVCGFSRRG